MHDGQQVPIRVLLADDHQLLRRAMRAMLEIQGPVEVVAEASDGYEAIELTDLLKPDVVLMDIELPELDGISATEQIVAADSAARVIIVTNYDHAELRHAAREAGACGYVLKENLLSIRELIGTR